MSKHIISHDNIDCQVLHDKKTDGKENKWAMYKRNSELVAAAYDLAFHKSGFDNYSSKASRCRSCASFLLFDQIKNRVTLSERLRLVSANFCRVRLCSMCSWRRSRKIQGQMRRIIGDALEERRQLRYILITLTVPNCQGDKLSSCLDMMQRAFNRFKRFDEYKRIVGYYKGLEITHNVTHDTYHPHYHILVAVEPSYYKSGYVKQSRWLQIWNQCVLADSCLSDIYGDYFTDYNDKLYDLYSFYALKIRGQLTTLNVFKKVSSFLIAKKEDEYKESCFVTQVDLRSIADGCTSRLFKSINEVCKYAVKPHGLLLPDDMDYTADIVMILDDALNRRRLMELGGYFKELHKKLNLDDAEDGDLSKIADDDLDTDEYIKGQVSYFWHTGYSQYLSEV